MLSLVITNLYLNRKSDIMPEILKAIILSFPLNPRQITDKLLEDIQAINLVTPDEAFGSNMRLVRPSTTRVKLFLPNFSDKGFSTAFSVSGDMPEERLAREINVYGLAASIKKFNFVHYISRTHLVVCVFVEGSKTSKDYEESLRVLNDLNNFLQLPPKADRRN